MSSNPTELRDNPTPPKGKPFFCFEFSDWLARPCGHKGCARRKVNKAALRV